MFINTGRNVLSTCLLMGYVLFSISSFAQCGSCTNPTGNVSVGSGSVCYDANTAVTSFTVYNTGIVNICDNVTVTVTGGSGFSGSAQLQMGKCSQIDFQGSLTASGTDWVVYTGDGTCDSRFTIEGSTTLGTLTSSSAIQFCNINNVAYGGSPGSATIGCNLPLPIELTSFYALQKGDSVQVNWTTASESNNNYFTVERSVDGNRFTSIALVKGAGNSSSVEQYSCYDANPQPGTDYYRLKQTDDDGSFKYFQVKAVRFSPDFNVRIVCSSNDLTTWITSQNACNADITIYNLLGQTILRQHDHILKGINEFKSEIGDHPVGTGELLIFHARIGSKTIVKKIIMD